MINWILAHKKGLLLSIAALAGLYVAIVNLIPGNQGEDIADKIHKGAEKAAETLPPDAQ